ncbi:hypothetical protein RhiirA5_385383 [Rhizophagus irregularis]|uniref:Uncharacterized protein n=1 Tax=Rhizophagus irregularis TaxID=588596 RepID=A0A2I1FDD0_9GLOM|nr:hypothetical protein RhiirA5_385383 [Rhizophagus irregularis]PKC65908.1 hypothetical protein RhiirA1_394895 [Rhizophagus irregularis]PKY32384.1 hypothetical protein RhiirB3_394000 [Rhizophagus irregularis]
MNMKYSYDYFDKLGDPDEQFIKDFIKDLKDLKILYDEKDKIDDIEDIDSLMEYIKGKMHVKGKMQADLEEIKIITENESQQFKFIFPEIYNESTVKWKNDDSIRKLINHCINKNKKKEYKYMLVISHLLPILVENSYKNLIDELVTELTYTKVPEEWYQEEGSNKIQKKESYLSIREELWGYRFPRHKVRPLHSSIFDRIEKVPRHQVTLCYVPLPGLCTFPNYKDNNILFPRGASPFVKLVMSNSDELLDEKHASSKIFESPFFHAIVKFKWHIHGRIIFIIVLLIYLAFFLLFVTSITLDFNKDKAIVDAIKNYTNKITIEATKSYITVITATIGSETNSMINNVTIAETVKSNIGVITAAISKASVEVNRDKLHIITLAINNAAIEVITSEEINQTIINLAINDATIAEINSNYVTEINKSISNIDITTLNETINSTGGRLIMIVCLILVAMAILLLIRHTIIVVKNGFGKKIFTAPSTYVLIASAIVIVITGFMELKFLDYGSNIRVQFQAVSIFLLWICFIGLLCLFKKIGVFIISKYLEQYPLTVIMHICRRTLWLVFLLCIFIFGIAHSMLVATSMSPPEFDDEKNSPKENTFDGYVAFVNNIYEETRERAYTEWTVIRARVLVFLELAVSFPQEKFFLSFLIAHFGRDDKGCFPPTILYEVPTQKVEEWFKSKQSSNETSTTNEESSTNVQ